MSVEITQADWRRVDEFEDMLSTQLSAYLRDRLAAYFAKHRSTSTEEVERLRTALERIYDLPGELNLANYNEDDVRELNESFVEVILIAEAALKQKATSHVE